MPNENESPAGVPDGTVLATTNLEGEVVHETVVVEDGGTWHKEVEA